MRWGLLLENRLIFKRLEHSDSWTIPCRLRNQQIEKFDKLASVKTIGRQIKLAEYHSHDEDRRTEQDSNSSIFYETIEIIFLSHLSGRETDEK